VKRQFAETVADAPELQAYVPHCEYHLVDLSAYRDEELRGAVFRPTAPLTLKHRVVNLQVPDEAIAHADHLEGMGVSDEARVNHLPSSLDTLLGQDADDPWLKTLKDTEQKILDIPEDQLPELTAKQMERIAAFARRAER
jgi:hypothetical protein